MKLLSKIFFIISFLLFFVKTDMNYMKLINCLKNNENLRKTGDKILSDLKIDMYSTILTMYSKLEERSGDYKICEKKANNSFEFDSICVLKCLNEFKNDYDYSCLSSCYY